MEVDNRAVTTTIEIPPRLVQRLNKKQNDAADQAKEKEKDEHLHELCMKSRNTDLRYEVHYPYLFFLINLK